jgi:hypothetical protein
MKIASTLAKDFSLGEEIKKIDFKSEEDYKEAVLVVKNAVKEKGNFKLRIKS